MTGSTGIDVSNTTLEKILKNKEYCEALGAQLLGHLVRSFCSCPTRDKVYYTDRYRIILSIDDSFRH